MRIIESIEACSSIFCRNVNTARVAPVGAQTKDDVEVLMCTREHPLLTWF